jgi:hypothetical protein
MKGSEMSESKSKREYVKPRMQTIDLSSGEVMTAGCKTDSGANGVGDVLTDPPFNGCVINGCSAEIGS